MRRNLIGILILVSFLSISQTPQRFYTKFGGYGHDVGYSVIQTLKGDYAVTGSTSSYGNGNTDVYLAIIDSTGWPRLEKSYGGFNNDIGKSIIQLPDSGFVIAGYTNSFGNGGYDVFLVRTDKNGNMIWQKTFGGLDWDFGYCLRASPANDSLIICGSTYSYGRGKSDAYIIKTDINGNFKWQKTYGGPENDEFKSFIIAYNNMYTFAGMSESLGDTKGDAWLFKTNLNGDSILSLTYGDMNKKQYFNDIAVNPNNNKLILCGGWDKYGTDTIYGYILFADENGIQQLDVKDSYKTLKSEEFYSATYGNKYDDFAYTRRQPNSSADSRLQAMIMMLNPIFLSSSVTNSINKYGSNEDDELFDIANTRDKGFICVGYTKSYNANLTDVFLVKMDSMMTASGSAVSIYDLPRQQTQNLVIYPTITNSYITIKNNGVFTDDMKIEIHSSIGQIILSKRSNGLETIDLSPFSEGIYYVIISGKNYSGTFKIIKMD